MYFSDRELVATQASPRLAAVETLQREQNLTSLAPKRGLIAAQPIEGIVWQVGQADKGPCEIVGWICRRRTRMKGAATGLVVILLPVLFRGEAVSVRAVDDLRRLLMGLSALAKLKQVFSPGS